MANGISKCFIAGTLVCTVNGLMAIENIVAGDMVLSANPMPVIYGHAQSDLYR